MKQCKIRYYTDELNDDFAGTKINTCEVTEDFTFVNKNIFWRICEAVVYRGIVTPLVWVFGKVAFGLKIKNRKVLKSLKRTGYFLYGNHTQGVMDAFTPSLCTFPKKAHIVVNPDAVSIKGIRQLVLMLGGLPLPTDMKGYKPFRDAIKTRVEQNRVMTIYPEAHIWPYYTGIRPFKATSFSYPVSLSKPCVAFTTTYRQRKILKNAYPKITVTISEPFYPDKSLSEKEARQKLRDEVYGFMTSVANSEENYEYIKYVKRPENEKLIYNVGA